jgi:hypothetical protein
MRFAIIICVTLLLGLYATQAHALNGEQLLDGLRIAENPVTQSSLQAGLSVGFVSGVASVANSAGTLCASSTLSAQQMAAVVKKYLEDNPATWNLPADSSVIQALQIAFPCPRNRR